MPILHIQLPAGSKIIKSGKGSKEPVIVASVPRNLSAKYVPALWVKSFDTENPKEAAIPKDGKGFSFTGRARLRKSC